MESVQQNAVLNPDDGIVQVRMLGGFSIRWKGELVHLERTNRTKVMQILQILLYMGENGATSEMLMEELFGEESIADPANNLKVTISHLRKTLKNSILGESFQVQYCSGGYYLKVGVPMWMDIREFAACTEPGVSSPDMLLRAESLYEGEFLPHLNDLPWVGTVASFFRERYFDCLHRLYQMLSAQNEWRQLLLIAGRAAARYPQEDWYCICMKCLIELKQLPAARDLYRQALRILSDELNTDSSGRLEELLHQLEELEKQDRPYIEGVFDSLQEPVVDESPYYCSYASFTDLYRISCRVMPYRTKLSHLVVYRFSESGEGQPLSKDSVEIEQAAELLRRGLQLNLRRSDTYTRYGTSIYLVLLIDSSWQDCVEIDRSIRRFYDLHQNQEIVLHSTISRVGENFPVGSLERPALESFFSQQGKNQNKNPSESN